jgi:hypothetical protein
VNHRRGWKVTLAIAERVAGDAIVVAVSGDLTADSGIGVQLREAVRHLLQLGHRNVVLSTRWSCAVCIRKA